MTEHKKVVVNNQILNGNPYVEGTKLTVFDIVSDCKYDGIEVFLDSSAEIISIDDLRYVFEYCKTRQCDKDGGHCGGCTLRPQQDGIRNEKDFIARFAEVRFSGSNKVLNGSGSGVMVMPGTPEELPQTWRGEDGWLIASELLENMCFG